MTAAAAAAAVTLLRLPIARLSSSLRSASSPSPPLSPPLLRLSASHGLPYPLLAPCHGRCLAVAAVAEAVGAPGAEEMESSEEERQGDSDPRPSFVLPRLPRPKLSVKERKELASYAHGLGRKLKSQQVGKGGVTPAVVAAFNDNLESNELLKGLNSWRISWLVIGCIEKGSWFTSRPSSWIKCILVAGSGLGRSAKLNFSRNWFKDSNCQQK